MRGGWLSGSIERVWRSPARKKERDAPRTLRKDRDFLDDHIARPGHGEGDQ
jgi:hypothetical protein